MRVDELLENLREQRGISVRELAKRLGGKSPTTVGKWLTSEGDPRLSELRALAEFFEVPLSKLLDGEDRSTEAELPSDELAVVSTYRALKRRRRLDRQTAVEALQDAADSRLAVAASGVVVVHEEKRRGVSGRDEGDP